MSYLWDVLLHLLPFQTLRPYGQYLAYLSRHSPPSPIHQQAPICLLCFLLSLYLLENLYLWKLSSTWRNDPIMHMRYADVAYITTNLDIVYPCYMALQTMLLYFLKVLFTVPPHFIRLMQGLLFREGHPILVGVSIRKRTPLASSRLILQAFLNLIHPLILIDDVVLFVTLMAIGSAAIKQPGDLLGSPFDNPLIFTFNLVRLSITYCLLFLFIWTYSMVAITVGAFSMTTFIIFLLRLGYNQKKYTAWRKAVPFTWAPLYPYLAYNTATLRYLFIANDPLGRIFVAFLNANIPVSAVLFIILVTRKKKNQGSNSGVLILLIQGLLGCVPIQLAAAQLTKRLHAPAKALLTLSAATGHRMGNLRARIRLHLAIVKLHTAKKYGFTYGPFGLITMSSFGKCMLLYGECLMYAYKLVKGI